MKIKILDARLNSYWYSDSIGEEFDVIYVIEDRENTYRQTDKPRYIRNVDSVITELPESFCVKRGGDGIKWGKYIDWLNKTYESEFDGNHWECYGIWENGFYCEDKPFGTEIHIDDMIKHIDYMNTEFDLTTNEGRLGYARKYYPIGTKYISLGAEGQAYRISEITSTPKYFGAFIEGGLAYIYANGKWADIIREEEFDLTTNEGRLAYAKKHYPIGCTVIEVSGEKFKSKVKEIHTSVNNSIKLQFGAGLLYNNITGEWAEIIKEEVNMETQKLSRQGLKEIHSVACSAWKQTLEQYGSRNPLEDYIDLTQEEVNQMFDACTPNQLPIVSKYLKKDDLLDFDKISGSIQTPDGQQFIGKRVFGKFENKSFYLHNAYDWEIKEDDLGELCLIPTKKK